MKICHIIKLADEEKAALNKAGDILAQLANDDILSLKFDNEYGEDIAYVFQWFDNLMDFIGKFES